MVESGAGRRSGAPVAAAGAIVLALGALVVAVWLVTRSSAPSRADLVTKLETHNGLTAAEARCVADGVWEKLDAHERRTLAEADNMASLPTATTQAVRDVIDACVPSGPAAG